jgi:transposase
MRSIDADAASKIAELEAALASERAALATERAALAAEREQRQNVEAERDRLRAAYEALKSEVELARHRITVAKAERIDTTQLEIEFATKLAALDALAGMALDPAVNEGAEGATPPNDGKKDKKKRKGGGRRALELSDLPEERIEIPDPALDSIALRIGTEESFVVGYRRGGFVRIRMVRFKYKVPGEPTVASAASATPPIVTAETPLSLFPKSMATPSLVAHIATHKFCWGLPLNRQAERFAYQGFPVSRGTMSRWLEEAGAVIGATLVEAMRREAMRTAFCIATDATGILVQPIPREDRTPQPCNRAHMFVQIADADHVFFEFTERETGAVVAELFRGFEGFVQADAKSVFNVLYRPPKERDRVDDEPPDLGACQEVGCWSHARTKHWEAAIATQSVVAREALARIMRMFQYERAWKTLPHEQRKAIRDQRLRPHVVAFFTFVEHEFEKVKHQRGMLSSALGYCVRQKEALMRFLDDGRLEMTNNHSERQLRKIATGRNAWLFVGSNDHGHAAANLLTVIASARLHRLDPELYVRDLFRVLPHWPRERYIELAPRYWRTTRARLDPDELAAELGALTIPEMPLPTPTHAQRAL